MRHTLAALPFVLVLCVAALAPSMARACWDGYRATAEHVEVTGTDDTWSSARARSLAVWVTRLEALVAPVNGFVMLEGDYLSVTRGDGTAIEIGSDDWTPPRLFAAVARALGLGAAARRVAMSATAEVLTVEVGTGLDVPAAERLAQRIDEQELGEHGFYEAGGFPAMNATAHVLGGNGANGPGRARVVVGVFLDRRAAEQLATRLRAELSIAARVRAL